MILKVVNSNSDGNCYILETESGEALIVECGVRFDLIKQALKYRIDRVAGCLITHSHGDHCKAVKDVLKAGIKVWATQGEHVAMGTFDHHNAEDARYRGFLVGQFQVLAFRVIHDTPEPVGYLIHHDECGTVLFLTDTVYSPVRFDGLNNIIVEANYCEEILNAQYTAGMNKKHYDHVVEGHMSIANCKDLLLANDLSQVNNIVLIHLSDGNSDARRFQREVQEVTGKTVHVADAGLTLPFNKTPF